MKTEKIKEIGKGRKDMGKCDKEGRGGNKAGNRRQKKQMLGLSKIREAVLISIHFDQSVDAGCLII